MHLLCICSNFSLLFFLGSFSRFFWCLVFLLLILLFLLALLLCLFALRLLLVLLVFVSGLSSFLLTFLGNLLIIFTRAAAATAVRGRSLALAFL